MQRLRSLSRAAVYLLLWSCGASIRAVGAENSAASLPYAWIESDRLASQCLNLREAERKKFRSAGKLLQLRPVALPRGDWLYKSPSGEPLDHLGWPVGVQINGALCVFYIRITAHGKYEGFHKAAVARSTDGGRTFHQTPSLKNSALDFLDSECLKYLPTSGRTNFGSWGNAAAAIEGRLVVTNFRGVYRSADAGKTWEWLRRAGRPAQIPTKTRWGQSPKLLVHPTRGLVSIGATTSDELAFRWSTDQGLTWKEQIVHTGEPLQEPAGTVYRGKLILMPRHDRERWTQFWSKDDWLPLKSAHTNITPGERDTTDVIYNPVSKRIEAIVTNRIGGGPGHENDNCMTINLWSIPPDELTAGKSQWRFDGTLLRSEGREHDKNNSLGLDRDGMHPGGSVVDAAAGYQYVYIYLGYFPGPSGVFQIRRTLDTSALRKFLLAN